MILVVNLIQKIKAIKDICQDDDNISYKDRSGATFQILCVLNVFHKMCTVYYNYCGIMKFTLITFTGDCDCEKEVNVQHFGDSLCLHHQD